MQIEELTKYYELSSVRHSHLCPRQVLGVRIGAAGAAVLGLDIPRTDKRMLVVLETDGCFADGIQAITGCSIGHRTLRFEDYGKVAATFIDVKHGTAVRIWPRPDVRQRAYAFAPEEKRHYFAQLKAYQVMPDEELLCVQPVEMTIPVEQIVSRAGVRVNCAVCGEEIINEREIHRNGLTLCRACDGQAYYRLPLQVSSRCLRQTERLSPVKLS